MWWTALRNVFFFLCALTAIAKALECRFVYQGSITAPNKQVTSPPCAKSSQSCYRIVFSDGTFNMGCDDEVDHCVEAKARRQKNLLKAFLDGDCTSCTGDLCVEVPSIKCWNLARGSPIETATELKCQTNSNHCSKTVYADGSVVMGCSEPGYCASETALADKMKEPLQSCNICDEELCESKPTPPPPTVVQPPPPPFTTAQPTTTTTTKTATTTTMMTMATTTTMMTMATTTTMMPTSTTTKEPPITKPSTQQEKTATTDDEIGDPSSSPSGRQEIGSESTTTTTTKARWTFPPNGLGIFGFDFVLPASNEEGSTKRS